VSLIKGASSKARSPGQNAFAGSFRVTNTSSATRSVTAFTIEFSNPVILSSARVDAVRNGVRVATATVVSPSSSAQFALNQSVAIKSGKSLKLKLNARMTSGPSGAQTAQSVNAITTSPAASFTGMPVALGAVKLR